MKGKMAYKELFLCLDSNFERCFLIGPRLDLHCLSLVNQIDVRRSH